MTNLAAVIVDEIDEIEQRDRKICISLDRKVSDANRELAQWLIDHPRYSQRVIARWLGCEHTRIFYLRKWATNGFQGMPFGKGNKRDDRPPNHRNSNGAARHQSPLASQTNFEDDTFDPDDAVEDPIKVLHNVLDSIKQSRSVAEAYRKILKASPFDREAKKQINEAIVSLIKKWRSVQTLLRRGETNGKLHDA